MFHETASESTWWLDDVFFLRPALLIATCLRKNADVSAEKSRRGACGKKQARCLRKKAGEVPCATLAHERKKVAASMEPMQTWANYCHGMQCSVEWQSIVPENGREKLRREIAVQHVERNGRAAR